MLKTIDVFLNRLLYAYMEPMTYMVLLVAMIVAALLMLPLYCLPFWRDLLKKKGVNSYRDWIRITLDSFKRMNNPGDPFLIYRFSIILFYLPINLLVNIWALAAGRAACYLIVKNLPFYVVLVAILSCVLDEFVFYRKKRYLNYFAIFEKESRSKKTIWSVGAYLVLCILIAANFFSFSYMVGKIHH
ncbi:MAG: hypothetical protein J6M53_07400 [Bacteroidaceae bacterium]|nr:hypothetical protein [Bacteroidaceae bacterium]